MIAVLSGCTAPRMIEPENVRPYYFNASVRLSEMGIVVLHFAVGADGRVGGAIDHDEPFIVGHGSSQDSGAAARLVEGAERYIRDAKFDVHGLHKQRLTASFVFEIEPCGKLAHPQVHDYAISLCREPPPPILMPAPHCRVVEGGIQC